MVISFEEKDREKIEKTGLSIIQAKQVLYKFVDFFYDVWGRLRKHYASLSDEQKVELLKSVMSEEN